MLPLNTSPQDLDKVLGYMSGQIGWLQFDKMKKALDAKALDARKLATMTHLGLLERDEQNYQITDRGRDYVRGDKAVALEEAVFADELYRQTLEWFHWNKKNQVTPVDVGQYWKGSHGDVVGNVVGDTLKDGAICFFKLAEGAGFGTYTVGRGGKQTRFDIETEVLARVFENVKDSRTLLSSTPTDRQDGASPAEGNPLDLVAPPIAEKTASPVSQLPSGAPTSQASVPPVVTSVSPSVQVNVEIHIAANATADTVREIFANMAKYILDKPDR